MRRWIFMVIGVSLLLAACGNEAEPTAVAAPMRWDPCSIPPRAIEATGLNPDYRFIGWGDGIVVEDWARCMFKPPGRDIPFVVTVMSSITRTFEEAKTNPDHFDGRAVDVGARDAYEYVTRVGRTGRSCNIAIELEPGVVEYAVSDMSGISERELCGAVMRYATELQHLLPAPAR